MRFLLVFIALSGFCSPLYAGFEDKLKEALEEYVEKETDGALDKWLHKGEKSKAINLRFVGAELFETDKLTPLADPAGTDIPAPPPTASTNPEKACFDLVQGKIAWDHAGHKTWSPTNINRLCQGAVSAPEPGKCFQYTLFNGSDWGQTTHHKVGWSEAVSLCAGTANSATTTQCFKTKISAGQSVPQAITACGKKELIRTLPVATLVTRPLRTNTVALAVNQEKACYDYVQGNIPWDNAGKNKNWSAANVNRLCKGTTSQYSPGNCFKYVMFDGNDWGKRTADKVDWQVAVDLCEGISNNRDTTSCFKEAIKSGKTLADAIKQCEK